MFSSKPVLIVRHRLLRLPVYFVLLVLSYVFLCDRIENLDSLERGKTVVLAGFVEEVFRSPGQEHNIIYKLRDITGETYLLTQKTPPREGTVLIVWGTKAETEAGRPILLEKNRVGDLFWRVILFLINVVGYLFGV